MKLPKLTCTKVVSSDPQPGSAATVTPQGCNVGCLISKAPHCIGKIIAGDIPGAILCAGSAAAECGCF